MDQRDGARTWPPGGGALKPALGELGRQKTIEKIYILFGGSKQRGGGRRRERDKKRTSCIRKVLEAP